MVVEDELIVADDIKTSLQKLGYDVVATVSSGEQSIAKAEQLKPDLVLMDIILKKEMDGIEAADIIVKRFNIPVIFLTAHSDDATLKKAKVSEPYGYILKPFDERDLLTNIEIALYKHKMETRLKMSEQWFSTTLKSIGDAIIATDNKGNVKFMNSIAEDITGWTMEQSGGKNLNQIFKIINESTLEEIENPIEVVLRKGSAVSSNSHTLLISKNGNRVPIDNSASPIKSENGDIQGVVMVFHDLTEKKKLQEKLMKKQKLESLGVLAGGIAHDFNNILTAVMGNISISMLSLNTDSVIFDNLSKAEKACKRASELSNQLITFSKGGSPLKKTINIAELLRDCVQLVLNTRDIKYTLDIKGESLKVQAQRSQLTQVISNILINSVESISTGGLIKISLDTVDLDSDSEPAVKEKFIRISIEDNGTGIDKESIGKIFDPYFTTKNSGSGLGLAIVNSVIEQHGGSIEVDSNPGGGTKFTIYLPASDQQLVTESPYSSKLMTGRGKILVMDDEPQVRELTQNVLRQVGYEVQICSDGKEVIEKYVRAANSDSKFDLVILDLIVPQGMGGIETVEKLLDFDPHVSVIAMTGYTTNNIKTEYLDYGFKGFTQKPYDIKELSELVFSLISAGQKEKQVR